MSGDDFFNFSRGFSLLSSMLFFLCVSRERDLLGVLLPLVGVIFGIKASALVTIGKVCADIIDGADEGVASRLNFLFLFGTITLRVPFGVCV